MRWPIRYQILVPFTAILLTGVATTAISSAVMATRRTEQNTLRQLNQVIKTLGRSSFPFSQNVLEKMRGLSGAEFVAFDNQRRPVSSTLPNPPAFSATFQALPHNDKLNSLNEIPTLEVAGNRFFVATVSRFGSSPQEATLLVLYPEKSWQQARWDAALPPLAVGGGTILLMIVASVWVAGRLSGRIRGVQKQVAAIAAGDFRQMSVGGRRDEIHELVSSINRMSAQLTEMQQAVRQTERARLLGQLAGGLAHQLRNAITGAKLAVQIHQKRCRFDAKEFDEKDDDSLDVALRQLALTEEQLKGLLSLGKVERPRPVAQKAAAVFDDVSALVGPVCSHADVCLKISSDTINECMLADSESVRTAILNLTLNAIEAAGPGGEVVLRATSDEGTVCFEVSDSGPGPPAELADKLFDAFVTGKPDGVGLGLALAEQIAREHDGRLTWNRADDRTHFRFEIPIECSVDRASLSGENDSVSILSNAQYQPADTGRSPNPYTLNPKP